MVPLLALPLVAGSVITLPAAAPAAAASCAEFSFTNPYLGYALRVPRATLSEGSTGPCVILLQQELNFVINAHLTVDGVFGNLTHTAVQTFQGRHAACTRGIDGIAGHYTMSCLGALSG
jgi:peptidoglycan hydrolase-like protein with peptidoglycan-binding domain